MHKSPKQTTKKDDMRKTVPNLSSINTSVADNQNASKALHQSAKTLEVQGSSFM
jgi:hypothetical protein